MTQYVLFQTTPEVVEAIEGGRIVDLTPNKVYRFADDIILDDDGYGIFITAPERYFCPHLHNLAQWQYCDADGNIL